MEPGNSGGSPRARLRANLDSTTLAVSRAVRPIGGSSDLALFGNIFLWGALDFLRIPTRTTHPD